MTEVQAALVFAVVPFLGNTANNKTANTKSNNDLKTGVPFFLSTKKCKNIYTKTQIVMNELKFLNLKN